MSSVEIEFAGGAGGRLAAGAVAGSALADVADRAARAAGRVGRGVADTLLGGGSAVAPAAGANFAATAPAPAGVYEIFVVASLGPGAVAADVANMALFHGAAQIAGAVLGIAGPGAVSFGPIRHTSTGVTYSVRTIGAGTAAVAYAALISATRIE